MTQGKEPLATIDELFHDTLSRVTRVTLLPGETTGLHTHPHDYVVIPVRGGTVTVEDSEGSRPFVMTSQQSYRREAGVTHSLTNSSEDAIEFFEVEYVDTTA